MFLGEPRDRWDHHARRLDLKLLLAAAIILIGNGNISPGGFGRLLFAPPLDSQRGLTWFSMLQGWRSILCAPLPFEDVELLMFLGEPRDRWDHHARRSDPKLLLAIAIILIRNGNISPGGFGRRPFPRRFGSPKHPTWFAMLPSWQSTHYVQLPFEYAEFLMFLDEPRDHWDHPARRSDPKWPLAAAIVPIRNGNISPEGFDRRSIAPRFESPIDSTWSAILPSWRLIACVPFPFERIQTPTFLNAIVFLEGFDGRSTALHFDPPVSSTWLAILLNCPSNLTWLILNRQSPLAAAIIPIRRRNISLVGPGGCSAAPHSEPLKYSTWLAILLNCCWVQI